MEDAPEQQSLIPPIPPEQRGWLHRLALKIQSRREALQRNRPHQYGILLAILTVVCITCHHYYEKLLDMVVWRSVMSYALYIAFGAIALLLFGLDYFRAKKYKIPMSLEPWALVVVLACFIGWPAGSWQKNCIAIWCY
jgi:drug/metabolite transporter (DMT)-like permease